MERQQAAGTPRVRRLRRAERREQILDAATRAFAGGGFTGTGLDDVARAAGVTRDLLYRHFESKADMYRAVLDRACARLAAKVDADDAEVATIPALLAAAADDPDGFRLVFRYAAAEPEFRDVTDGLATLSVATAHRLLAGQIPDGPWLDWAARLMPTLTIEAVIAWLDAGRPDQAGAADRIREVVYSVIRAARA